MSEEASEQVTAPTFEVVSGNPTPEELAALVSVLTLATSAAPATTGDQQPRAGGWRSHWRSVRRHNVPRRGGDAWRNYHRL